MPIGASICEMYPARAGSSPELAFEPRRRLVETAAVRTGREVLPAAVRDDERDVGSLARPDRAVGLAERRMQDRAGGDPREDSLVLDELSGTAQRVFRPDREPGVEHARVVQLGHETLVDVAQAV